MLLTRAYTEKEPGGKSNFPLTRSLHGVNLELQRKRRRNPSTWNLPLMVEMIPTAPQLLPKPSNYSANCFSGSASLFSCSAPGWLFDWACLGPTTCFWLDGEIEGRLCGDGVLCGILPGRACVENSVGTSACVICARDCAFRWGG